VKYSEDIEQSTSSIGSCQTQLQEWKCQEQKVSIINNYKLVYTYVTGCSYFIMVSFCITIWETFLMSVNILDIFIYKIICTIFLKPGTCQLKAGLQLVSWNCFCPWCVYVCVFVSTPKGIHMNGPCVTSWTSYNCFQ